MIKQVEGDLEVLPEAISSKMTDKFLRVLIGAFQIAAALLPNLSLFAVRRRFQVDLPERSNPVCFRHTWTAFGVSLLYTLVLLAAFLAIMKGVVYSLEQTSRLRSAVYMFSAKKTP